VSTNSKKGYVAERAIEVLLQGRYPGIAENILRPRAGASNDKGDIHGLPVVISVKNWTDIALGPWVNECGRMIHHAGKGVGVVWHKRRGKGDPRDWYVTMDEPSFRALRDKFNGPIYLHTAGIVVSSAKLGGWLKITHAKRGDHPVAGLVHNRVGRSDRFVTMTGDDFLTLLDSYMVPDKEMAHG
jgi:hypothetical protein